MAHAFVREVRGCSRLILRRRVGPVFEHVLPCWPKPRAMHIGILHDQAEQRLGLIHRHVKADRGATVVQINIARSHAQFAEQLEDCSAECRECGLRQRPRLPVAG